MTTHDVTVPEGLVVDGRDVATSATIPVINPATGRVFAEAPSATKDDLDAAFAAAGRAFEGWKVDDALRVEALKSCAAILRGNASTLGRLLTLEVGRPTGGAEVEVEYAAAWFDFFAGLEQTPDTVQNDTDATIEVLRRPLGVVAAITPWNYPLVLASWKLGPALRAGNTVVLKPSPYTPFATLEMGRLLAQVLPAGVLNVVSGGDELGSWMTGHPVPRKISFTGSVATGRSVFRAAAADFKQVTLELGGNDAAIVLDDVDVPAMAEKLFWAAFSNSGQVCAAVKRVYVADSKHDELVDALASIANRVSLDDGFAPGAELGPVQNAAQYEKVNRMLADAISGGARAASGGRPIERDGYFIETTILTDAAEDSAIVADEQFGPVLPVLRFRDVDDAVARANGTSYGLGGSVWSGDLDRAWGVSSRLDVGTAWVNVHNFVGPAQPFGGLKTSGYGVEGGRLGIESFTEVQVKHIDRT